MHKITRKLLNSLLVLGLFAAVPALAETTAAADATAAAETQGAPGAMVAGAVTMTATVKSVDLENRTVTLIDDADGDVVTVPVSDEARNLDQVKVGDRVEMAYFQAVAVRLEKGQDITPGVVSTTEVARSAKGDRPAGIITERVVMHATVAEIDMKEQSVMLSGNSDGYTEVHVKDPDVLKQVEVGDVVRAEFVEGVAIKVSPAAAE